MAKESMKAREVKRVKLANRYAHKREEIAAKVKSGEMDIGLTGGSEEKERKGSNLRRS